MQTADNSLLIVDDDDLVRESLADMLQQGGFRVLEADGGDAALSVLAHSPEIAVMVTDISMPRMNGLELAGRASALSPSLRIVLMTGYTQANVPGDLPVLRKPFGSRALLDTVRTEFAAGPRPVHLDVASRAS